MAGVEAAATAAQGSKMLVIGVGGATSSGKTTLAKHLCSILQRRRQPQQQQEEQPPVSGGRSGLSAVILHQDDFALPEEQLPWNETLQARDWDHPVGTVGHSGIEKARRRSVAVRARADTGLRSFARNTDRLPAPQSHSSACENARQPARAPLVSRSSQRAAGATCALAAARGRLARAADLGP